MSTYLKAKKDLYNIGRCFTKDKVYWINKQITSKYQLSDITIVNDQGERHLIGNWYNEFSILTEIE